MVIDASKTIVAYDQLKKMTPVFREVHDEVLTTDYLARNSKRIMKAVKHIKDSNNELLVDTFIGKLRFKLPPLHLKVKRNAYDQQLQKITLSALITQILIDNGTLYCEKRAEPVFTAQGKKFFHRLYLVLGGQPEKDMLRGFEFSPGVVYQRDIQGWQLNAPERDFLKKVATVPFCVSEVCNKELLMKGYTLKTDWNKRKDKNGRNLPEDPIVRRKRFESYADAIVNDLKPHDCFYLPMKYCGRDRVYYEAASLEGLRPHGKLWETLMIDSAVPQRLDKRDAEVLKHLIYVTLHGRTSIDDAVASFTLEDLLDAEAIDPMEQVDEASFGEAILLNKAAKALMDYADDKPSKFMFGYDFTNSGLMMAGLSFKSEEMMKAGNVHGDHEIMDSHTAFGAGYDMEISRKDIKGVHTSMLHGSTLKSIAKKINEITGNDCDEQIVRESNERAYGKAVHNITFIADWGTKVIGNKQSTLRWTLPDGVRAQSRAYYKSVPIRVYVASAGHKEHYTSHTVVSDMPWAEDLSGYPIHSSEETVGGHVYKIEQKKRGLFANITHSIDAYVLRNVVEYLIDAGKPVLLKHDDYMVSPGDYYAVRMVAKDVFDELFTCNLYQAALDEIVEHSPYGLEAPQLFTGEADGRVIHDSENFLMP